MNDDDRPAPLPERTPWQRYIDLIRELDVERAEAATRTATQRHGAEAAALEVERLSPLLIDQGAELSHLARRLHRPQPRLSARPVEPTGSAYELVVRAARAATRAGSLAREAHQLATRPRVLPRWPARLRNFVIYLAWAVTGLAVQYGMVQHETASGNGTPPPAVILLVIPLIAFLGGLLTVSTVGRARLGLDHAGRSVRMGALVCFGIFPAGLLVLVLRSLVRG